MPVISANADGSAICNWNGVKVEWDNATGKLGVKSRTNLPNRFSIPVGGAYEVNKEEIEKLYEKGADEFTKYLVEYDCLTDRYTNKKKILASKTKTKENIIIDIHPRLEKVLNIPEDSWIGAKVNSVPFGEKSNSHFEIIGVEHNKERSYPNITFNLFIVLDQDVPAGSWLYRAGAEEGMKKAKSSVKTKAMMKKRKGCLIVHDEADDDDNPSSMMALLQVLYEEYFLIVDAMDYLFISLLLLLFLLLELPLDP